MYQAQITPDTLAGSVIAVPPLARNADFSLNHNANEKLIRHLENGGVSSILYGGNAVLYHISLADFAELMEFLIEVADDGTLMIPSVGPSFGTMMDQAAVLAEFPFPTAMILPTRDVATSAGVASGVRKFVEAVSKPAVLYIKHDGYIEVEAARKLVDDGLIAWIKYAVVREDTSEAPLLRELVDAVGADRIVSGIGEQPAIVHLRDFGLSSFTSGCVCVAPHKSTEMLTALKTGDFEAADKLRSTFRPLEDLRNLIHPIRVLHAAVQLADIAETGPVMPLLSEVDESDRPAIQEAATKLLAVELSQVEAS